MPEQLNHYNTPIYQHNLQLVVFCNYISSPANLGMIFRNADAFGVQKILLSPENVGFLESTRFKKIARNAAEQVSHEVVDSIQLKLDDYRNLDYQILALDFTTLSKPIQKIELKDKLCILLGHENTGIPNKLLTEINTHAHINLFGKNSSINVAQALGICLYEITK